MTDEDTPKDPGTELQGAGAINPDESPMDDPGWGDIDENDPKPNSDKPSESSSETAQSQSTSDQSRSSSDEASDTQLTFEQTLRAAVNTDSIESRLNVVDIRERIESVDDPELLLDALESDSRSTAVNEYERRLEDMGLTPDGDEQDSAGSDLPPVREWRSRSFRLNPHMFDEFNQQETEFQLEYSTEHGYKPEITPTFYSAIILSALSGTPLDDILEEAIENEVQYISQETIECADFG